MFFLVVVLTQEEGGAERGQGQGHPVSQRARARSRSVIETVRRKRVGGNNNIMGSDGRQTQAALKLLVDVVTNECRVDSVRAAFMPGLSPGVGPWVWTGGAVALLRLL